MLSKPQKTKYLYQHKLKVPQQFKLQTNLYSKVTTFFLICIENSVLTASQLLSAILTIKRMIKQNNKLYVKVFPHLSVTKRPPEQPLGKGKSNISYWATPIKTGTIIFELNTEDIILTNNAFKAARYKFPFKTQIINKLGQ